MVGPPSSDELRDRVAAWLREDAADRDVTSAALVPPGTRARGTLRAKAAGVVAGLSVAAAVFSAVDESVQFTAHRADGDVAHPGDILAVVIGPGRAILAAERTALNVLQRMSGVATHTARFVAAVQGTAARIFATRKTMPGLRDLDLAAVQAGGGDVHRTSLADRVLVKENHLAAARAAGWARSMADVVERLVGPDGPGVPIGVEVTALDELREALVKGVDVILVDNFTPVQCRAAVEIRDERFPRGDGPALEASGGVTLANVGAFAATGVERISVGALTHSAVALDISLTFEHEAGA